MIHVNCYFVEIIGRFEERESVCLEIAARLVVCPRMICISCFSPRLLPGEGLLRCLLRTYAIPRGL